MSSYETSNPDKEVIDCLEALLFQTNLSSWEEDFVNDTDIQRRKGLNFTERQSHKILQIYDRRVLGRDR